MSDHNDDFEHDVNMQPPPDMEAEVDFWGSCLLTRVMTTPPRYELRLPDGVKIGRLRSSHFFSPAAFTMAYVDAVGAFPPLPQDKTAGPFLLDVFQRLLEDRKDVEMVDEASDFGTLCADIKLAITSCPMSDDVRDVDRGALFPSPEGEGAWVNARYLMIRVGRVCPVKLTPGDFYSALVAVGLSSLDVRRHCGWRGRVWLVPVDLLPVVTAPMLPGSKPTAALANGEEGVKP